MIRLGPWVLLRKWELEERDQEMWSEGYHTDEDAVEAELERLRGSIEDKVGLIQQLMGDHGTPTYINWSTLPDDLRDALADYA